MRGDKIFVVYGVHGGRPDDVYFGSFRTQDEAGLAIARLRAKEMNGSNWASVYHDRGFVIREQVVETDFEIPPRPMPRDRFCARASAEEGAGGRIHVEVFERTPPGLVQRARYR